MVRRARGHGRQVAQILEARAEEEGEEEGEEEDEEEGEEEEGEEEEGEEEGEEEEEEAAGVELMFAALAGGEEDYDGMLARVEQELRVTTSWERFVAQTPPLLRVGFVTIDLAQLTSAAAVHVRGGPCSSPQPQPCQSDPQTPTSTPAPTSRAGGSASLGRAEELGSAPRLSAAGRPLSHRRPARHARRGDGGDSPDAARTRPVRPVE